jgi:TPR repeat protein
VLLLLNSGVAVAANYDGAYKSGGYKAVFKKILPFAEQGNADAQFWIASMYKFGQGVPENQKTAVKCYTLAVEQGYVLPPMQ